MTTPFESAMAKLAAIETWPTLTHSQQMTIAVVPALTSSEAAAIRERLDALQFTLLACDRFFRVAMPKMNVGASSLDAAAIHAWNMAEVAVQRQTAQPLPEPPNE